MATIDKIHRAFFTRGLSIKYDYIPVPTYGEFLRERDLEGRQQNFLNSSQEYRYLKRLQEENRIIPVVGDFSGSRALREIGIQVPAVHSHMLTEDPRLFFMHFWANDDAVKLAKGLRAALDKTNSAKPRQ